jgi:hypothetical protein
VRTCALHGFQSGVDCMWSCYAKFCHLLVPAEWSTYRYYWQFKLVFVSSLGFLVMSLDLSCTHPTNMDCHIIAAIWFAVAWNLTEGRCAPPPHTLLHYMGNFVPQGGKFIQNKDRALYVFIQVQVILLRVVHLIQNWFRARRRFC